MHTHKHINIQIQNIQKQKKERKENGPDRYICISKVMVREIL